MGKKAPAKAASNETSAKKAATKGSRKAQATNKSDDVAGVGNKGHPGNKHVPQSAVIVRPDLSEEGTKITASPEVQGDKALQIIDILNGKPVHVSLVNGVALTKEADGRLVFIEGPVAYDVKSVAAAKALFAIKSDGTVIYNPRGFDDVPANKEFDMLDIVKLIEHNNK